MSHHLLSKLVHNMSESATLKMAQLARDLQSQGKEVISLSLGEPDFDTPQHIKEAAKSALDQGYTKYTPVPGLPALREAISDKFERDNNLHYDPNQIVVSNGAKQAIANLCLALLNPGDEVVLFTPYWVSYFDIISMAKGKPVFLSADITQDFKVTPEQVRGAISDKTKMILFSSPCNPTGSVYTKEELDGLAEVIQEYPHIIVVSDEIYEYINFTPQHHSIGSIERIADQVVTVNGFSKGFAMTGWRLGYMGAPKSVADACAKIQGQFTSGAAAFSQMAGVTALTAPLSPTMQMKEAFHKRRDIVIQLLQEIPGIKANIPQGAFYIFPDVSDLFGSSYQDYHISNSTDVAMYLLQEAGVAVVAGEAFGADQCVRLSFAASEDQLRTALHQIGKAISALS